MGKVHTIHYFLILSMVNVVWNQPMSYEKARTEVSDNLVLMYLKRKN